MPSDTIALKTLKMTDTLKNASIRRIGILSDTHGYLSSAAVSTLGSVDLIIHAGDIDAPEVLESLKNLAPVHPVRGNMDMGPWADSLNEIELIDVGGILVYTLHDRSRLDLDPKSAGFRVVISGHTHRPHAGYEGDVLFLNPGSAAFPRHGFPPTLAVLDISSSGIDYRFIELPE